jgi:hypothetical protein
MNFAILALIGMQAVTPVPPCACAQFSPAIQAIPNEVVLSKRARVIRDFALYSHRRIVEDLIQQRGLYLETVLSYLPQCEERAAKLAWLRQVLLSTNDTLIFAERIAYQYEIGQSCGTSR